VAPDKYADWHTGAAPPPPFTSDAFTMSHLTCATNDDRYIFRVLVWFVSNPLRRIPAQSNPFHPL